MGPTVKTFKLPREEICILGKAWLPEPYLYLLATKRSLQELQFLIAKRIYQQNARNKRLKVARIKISNIVYY